jgi:hypothetical protein
MDYDKLGTFASCALDEKVCRAMSSEGSQRKAAKAVGISQSYLNERLSRLKSYAATRGYSPDTGLHDLQAPNQLLHGVSTLYDDAGAVKARWVKTRQDQQQTLEAARAMVEEMSQLVTPEEPNRELQVRCDKDLLNLYVLTDAHLGMYAHHEEGGNNWDLKIAEATIDSAFDYLVTNTPEASTAILLNLGDLLHSDSIWPVTPTNHHVLDQDSRQHRVIRTAIRVIRRTMQSLLSYHDRVVLVNAQGNHDMVSALWMQSAFGVLYENEPRAEVVQSPLPYYANVHGKNLLTFTHGHKKRGKELADLVCGQFRHLMAGTTHTSIHTGHLHTQSIIETPTATIECHPTLAARDSYSAHGGWLSRRGMQAIVYHVEDLEIARCVYRPTPSK